MPGGANLPQPPGSPNPFATGVVFAKRKKNIFKGPNLNFGNRSHHHTSRSSSSGSHSRSGSGTILGARAGEMPIQEEDEDPMEEDEDEFEEVDSFAPIVGGPGEIIEEQIIEDEQQLSTPGVESPTTPAHTTT